MFRILEQQAPAKQTASETISTLSGRLQSATLLEDRRAAILGLRSFAKLYPASVASGALRNLINSLTSDGEDVDTTKIVLETLLMLFSPDETSPEASDEIVLWLADEFTQRQENITVLLDLLERHDFFSRLYSLQLISAISSARPERTQECVYTAPLGIPRLVAILDDKREAIQNEALLLLVALTPASHELQKLVAFENAFDRIFTIMDAEGNLSRGGVVVQDCLSLLANLLRLNVSNQSFFREAGGITKSASILHAVLKEEESGEEEEEWASPQKDKNIWGFLSVIRLFLQSGGSGTKMNQAAFWQHGVSMAVLQLGYTASMSPAIRSEALFTCADLIQGNGPLQEQLARCDILIDAAPDRPSSVSTKPNVNGQSKKPTRIKVNTIQALIDVALAVSSQEPLDLRLAACECLEAYLQGHRGIRHYFLQRAQEGHLSEEREADNIFTILVDDVSTGPLPDPYRPWIASVLLFHLVYDDHDAKQIAMSIAEGDAAKGEEVVTCIQAISTNLVTSSQRGNDDRIAVAYLTLLCGWLFEAPEAINDFLQEGSNVQSLIQLALQTSHQKSLEAGLCAFLLGIIYEYSSKDSPIPRTKLHELLMSRLGRDQFHDRLTKLREHPYIRDFEVLPQGYVPDEHDGQPGITFDKLFVEFLKDSFSQILRSIDREPGLEVPVTSNGKQLGISRELVDSQDAQIKELTANVQRLEGEKSHLQLRMEQLQAELRKDKESSAAELHRIKNINDGLHRNHEQEMKQLQQHHEQETKRLQQQREQELKALHQDHQRSLTEQQRAQHNETERLRTEHQRLFTGMEANLTSRIATLEREKEAMQKEHESSVARTDFQHREELKKVHARVEQLEGDAARTTDGHSRELQKAQNEHKSRLEDLEKRLQAAEGNHRAAVAKAETAEKMVTEKEDARASVQTELDDLFMVLADLEEKRTKDKERLKALGEEVSGDEAEDDDEDEDEDDEDEDEEEDEDADEESKPEATAEA